MPDFFAQPSPWFYAHWPALLLGAWAVAATLAALWLWTERAR